MQQGNTSARSTGGRVAAGPWQLQIKLSVKWALWSLWTQVEDLPSCERLQAEQLGGSEHSGDSCGLQDETTQPTSPAQPSYFLYQLRKFRLPTTVAVWHMTAAHHFLRWAEDRLQSAIPLVLCTSRTLRRAGKIVADLFCPGHNVLMTLPEMLFYHDFNVMWCIT